MALSEFRSMPNQAFAPMHSKDTTRNDSKEVNHQIHSTNKAWVVGRARRHMHSGVVSDTQSHVKFYSMRSDQHKARPRPKEQHMAPVTYSKTSLIAHQSVEQDYWRLHTYIKT
jgi:hypothetical protein